jgi:soluble lytic murein transglycosylase-like protein
MRIFSVFLILALGIAAPGGAEGPKPFPEFEAKRVKPPSAGVGKRIKVQIAPSAPAPAAPAAPAQKAALQNPEGGYPWFWEKLRPEAEGAGPGRLQAALKVLAAQGAAVPSPRLQQLQDIAKANGIDILRATVGTNVSPALVLAVIAVESSGQPDAQSRAGAQGLMQLMPDTAARFGVADSFDPAQNISGGVKYLDWLMGTFDSDPILVLAGYNAGEGSLRKHGGVPPFAETRDYVPKVLAAFQTARGLCLTPPELISDGCVFAAMK